MDQIKINALHSTQRHKLWRAACVYLSAGRLLPGLSLARVSVRAPEAASASLAPALASRSLVTIPYPAPASPAPLLTLLNTITHGGVRLMNSGGADTLWEHFRRLWN